MSSFKSKTAEITGYTVYFLQLLSYFLTLCMNIIFHLIKKKYK